MVFMRRVGVVAMPSTRRKPERRIVSRPRRSIGSATEDRTNRIDFCTGLGHHKTYTRQRGLISSRALAAHGPTTSNTIAHIIPPFLFWLSGARHRGSRKVPRVGQRKIRRVWCDRARAVLVAFIACAYASHADERMAHQLRSRAVWAFIIMAIRSRAARRAIALLSIFGSRPVLPSALSSRSSWA